MASFHSSGTLFKVMDKLNKVVSGPTTPGPASFKRRYEIWSGPTEVLLGKNCMAFLASSAEKFWIVNEVVILVGPIGKPSELRQVFLCTYVLFKRFAFSPLPVAIFPALFRRGGGGCHLPFPIYSTKVFGKAPPFWWWAVWIWKDLSLLIQKTCFRTSYGRCCFVTSRTVNPPVILLPGEMARRNRRFFARTSWRMS